MLKNGVDITHIPTFKKIFSKESRLHRVFNDFELEGLKDKSHPYSSLAARFAIKEAFSKALGTGLYNQSVYPKDIWIEGTVPKLNVSEKIKIKFPKLSLENSSVSLSHHKDYAIAFVILHFNESF